MNSDDKLSTAVSDEKTIKGASGGAASGRGAVRGRGGTSAAGPGVTRAQAGAPAVPPAPVGGTIKVGLVIDTGNPGEAFGLEAGVDEATDEYAKAIVADLNAHGGLGKRKLQLFIQKVDISDQSSSTQTRLHNEACTALTEDAKVFLVVIASGNAFYGFDCYVRHRTPVLPTIPVADEEMLKKYQPWIMPSMASNFTRTAPFYAKALQAQHYLTKKMAIITFDTPQTRRTAKILIAELEKRGGKVIDSLYMPVAYEGLASSIASAALRFRQKGVDRAVNWVGSGGWYVFTKQAESQGYRPRYAFTSYDSAQAYIDELPDGARVPPQQLRGAVGAGFDPASDVPDVVYPPTAREKACWSVVNRRAGANFSSRRGDNAGSAATNLCEPFWVLRAAFAPAATKQIAQRDVPVLVSGLGRSFAPLSVPRSLFAPGRVDAAAVYRHLAYDERNDRFTYTTDWRDIPN